jgi:hypothetical protein
VLLTRTTHHNANGELIACSETVAVVDNWHTRTYTIAGT